MKYFAMRARHRKSWKRQAETWPRVIVSKRNRDGRACHGIRRTFAIPTCENRELREGREEAREFCAERKRDSSRSVPRIQNGHPPFSRRRREKIGSIEARVITGACTVFPLARAQCTLIVVTSNWSDRLYPCMDPPTLRTRLNFSPGIDN